MVPWGIILGCTWEVFFPWLLFKQIDGEDAVLGHDDAPRLGMPGQHHAVDLEFHLFTAYRRGVPVLVSFWPLIFPRAWWHRARGSDIFLRGEAGLVLRTALCIALL